MSSFVALIADADSALAAGIAAELAEHHHRIDRIGHGEHGGEPDVAVVLIERATSIDALRGRLDRTSTPTLVLAATRRLATDILPLLGTRHDLATAADSTDILLWRIQRLLQLSRSPTVGMAELDPLTGLLNRRTFERRLRHAIETIAPGEVAGLLYFDLDLFKSVNDCLGHTAGDTVLQALGNHLLRSLPPGDLVSRLGGDEFGCLLIRSDAASILRDGARLLKEVSELEVPVLRAKPSLPRLTASAGLTFIRSGVEATTMLMEADMAAYQAKSGGRNRLEVYGQLAEAAKRSSRDLDLTHFENVTRVATERLVEMITLKSRRLVDAAKEEANFCSLTGLHSRRYFDAQLTRDIEAARTQGRTLSLALIDLDHFHDVNMSYGWPTGDRVLQAFAATARANIRSTDWVARYGGEEFAIVMPDTSIDSARQVVERLRQAFASTTTEGSEGQRVAATLSAGVVQRPDDTLSAIGLVEQASKALLGAKGAGRNRVGLAG